MQATADRPTSITIGYPVTPQFAQDQQTRTWVLSGAPPERPTRVEVVRYAQRELAHLRRLPRGWDGSDGVPLSPELASIALGLVIAITTDDGLATPQFSPLPDGGVYITWLVGGDRLTLTLDADEISMCGVSREGHEAFRFEHEYGAFLASEFEGAINDAESFLLKISTRVQHQLLMS